MVIEVYLFVFENDAMRMTNSGKPLLLSEETVRLITENGIEKRVIREREL